MPRFASHYLVRQWQETDVSRNDAEARHHVGDDYPFLYDADDANLSASFSDFRAHFGSARWQFALRRLDEVKRRNSPAQIGREIDELFAGL